MSEVTPIVLDDLTRGDRATITISGLVDGAGNPAVFGAGDVLRFTAKATLGRPDSDALLAKTSADGGITFAIGGSTGTVHITPSDWASVTMNADETFDWDLQLLVGGDAAQVVTLARGTVPVIADVTGNPTTGPTKTGGTTCSPWATSADCIAPFNAGVDSYEMDLAMQIASDVLFEFTNRKYRGTCVDEIRPIARWRAFDGPPSWWASLGANGGSWTGPSWWGWCSCNRTEEYGCTRVPQITLPGFPVDPDSIVVTVDGDVFNAWELVDRRKLIRTDGGGFPCCQRMDLDTTNVGTWSVRYGYGVAPPIGGKRAATVLGQNLYALFHPEAGACQLPQRVTNISRQGVTLAVVDPLTLFQNRQTGIAFVDLWIASDTMGDRLRTSLIVPGKLRKAARTR